MNITPRDSHMIAAPRDLHIEGKSRATELTELSIGLPRVCCHILSFFGEKMNHFVHLSASARRTSESMCLYCVNLDDIHSSLDTNSPQ